MRAMLILVLLVLESTLRRALSGPGWLKAVARWLLLGYDEDQQEDHDND